MGRILEHPRLGEVTVRCTRRARRISVSVRPSGEICLIMPTIRSLRAGVAFLEEKEEWVSATVEKMRRKYPSQVIAPPYRTTRRELVFNSARTDKVSARVTADRITVTFPETLPSESHEVQETAKKAIVRALRAEAAEILPEMVGEAARRHGFRYRSVTVRATTSRWGSCSHNNDLSLSAYLILLPQHLVQYVIIHELCHTVHKDHSEKFHKLLDAHLGGREKELVKEIRGYRPGIIARQPR